MKMEEQKTYSYQYPRPALTVDCVIFGYDSKKLDILLIKRGIEPFKGQWALPGGFVRMEESAEEAAIRELREETGLLNVYMEQLYTFSQPERDPRGRTVSVAFFALINKNDFLKPQGGDDASEAEWFNIKELPNLAFDHKEIINVALNRLKGKIKYQPVGFELLPEYFTLVQLQVLYEIILETAVDKRNFRRKILNSELLIESEKVSDGSKGRRATLYKFDKTKYEELSQKGVEFNF